MVGHGGRRRSHSIAGTSAILGLDQIVTPMDKKLLDIICCPLTKLPLEPMDEDRLRRLNKAIQAGQINNHGADKLAEELNEALVTRDGRLVYPIRDGIPVLLEEESIDWNQMVE